MKENRGRGPIHQAAPGATETGKGRGARISRRGFLQGTLAAGGALALPFGALGCGESGSGPALSLPASPKPVLFIALDSLDPRYLRLNRAGDGPGEAGDWLMPRLQTFLAGGTRFADARCFLPSATDMNHLNVLAGTSSAQTGVIGVTTQVYNWNPDRTPILGKIHTTWTRDDRGRQVDTLFRAWKRAWPGSKTAFVSGKGWVADMYRSTTAGVDLFVTGGGAPTYVENPYEANFYDPPTDPDAATDPESAMQAAFCEAVFHRDAKQFPPDSWVVEAALDVLRQEQPSFGLILLAQTDDAQHGLGAAWDLEEFEACPDPLACGHRSRKNPRVYREPILDAIRDVDEQFGRLVDGLGEIDAYRDATIVLYSDHGHTTHLLHREAVPIDFLRTTDVVQILYDNDVISAAEMANEGFCALAGCSLIVLYWQSDSLEERRRRAREAKPVLLAHEALNPETNTWECPWIVLDQEDMRTGHREAPDGPWVVAPGEMWHPYFGPRNDADNLIWPDLVLFMKNGWQAPIYDGLLGNLGVDIPFPLPPMTPFIGGHGAPDTQQILMAMRGPGIAAGRVVQDAAWAKDYRIADLTATVLRRTGLTLRSTVVGRDRSADLVP